MPVFNGGGHLDRAIEALLLQTYPDFELLISDNASTDETEDISRTFAARDGRIRYERQPVNIGPVANFNRVLERASGEYFMWAAHDDLWDPTYLERCINAFGTAADVVATAACASVVDSPTGRQIARDSGFSTIGLSPAARFRRYKRTIHNGQHYGAILYGLFRRHRLLRAGPLTNTIAWDHVLIARLCFLGTICTVPETLFYKTWGGASSSYEKMAAVMGIRDRTAIAVPMFWRELALQRAIFETDSLTRPEKVVLAAWSWANYLRRHGYPDARSWVRMHLELLPGGRRLVRYWRSALRKAGN